MIGLMIHELGHVYQSQYGSLSYQENSMAEKFLWQLFTEGVAMVFEQEIVGTKTGGKSGAIRIMNY